MCLQMSLGGSPVTVVQLPGGQFQVQGVIQSAQSVIQSPQMQTVQVRAALTSTLGWRPALPLEDMMVSPVLLII